MTHDHKEIVDPLIQALFSGSPDPVSYKNEDSVREYFEKVYPDIDDKALRFSQAITFTAKNKTELLPQQNGSHFQPFKDTPNNQIGVVQDAGFVLFKAIGAQNVITFGSVLDQAGKPRSPRDNPIAYAPAATSLTFKACHFGFNPATVGDITIRNFTGTKATCDIVLIPEGKRTSTINLNKTGDDFLSIEQVAKLAESDAKKAGFIGKALGDITLVASLCPKLTDDTPNPFYPGGKLPWKSLAAGGKVPPAELTKFILNTGDRLNHIRAVKFGVGSVYSSSTEKSRKFVYVPGIVADRTPDDQFNTLLERIKMMIVNIDKTYQALSQHIGTELIAGGFFNPAYSSKSGIELITDPKTVPRATEILVALQKIVEAVRVYVLHYFLVYYLHHADPAVPRDLAKLQDDHTVLLESARILTPSSTTTLGRGGRDIRSLVHILNTPYLFFSVYPITDADRFLFNENYRVAVEAISDPPAAIRFIPYSQVNAELAKINPGRIIKNISEHLPVTAKYGISGSYDFYVSNIYQFIGKKQKIISPFRNLFEEIEFSGTPVPTTLGGSVVGGAHVFDAFAVQYDRPSQTPPVPIPPFVEDSRVKVTDIFKLYIRYCGGEVAEALRAFHVVCLTYNFNPRSIIDETLLESLYNELQSIDVGFNMGIPTRSPHTMESLHFNAFACRYNSAMIEEYGYNEDLFKSYMRLRPKRGGGSDSSSLSTLLNEYATGFEELAKMSPSVSTKLEYTSIARPAVAAAPPPAAAAAAGRSSRFTRKRKHRSKKVGRKRRGNTKFSR